jgi:phosphatidate cytidylyltransferase
VLLGAAAVALLTVAAGAGYDEWSGAFTASVAATFLFLVLKGDPQAGLRDWVWSASGVAYVGLLGSHLVFLREIDDDGDWVILAVFGTFCADTAAYLAGRAIGRVRIAPAISPGKTVEGTVAGIAGGIAAVLALNWATGLDIEPAKIIPLAVLLPIAAVVGDLAESLIKRGAGIKDTGGLIPGHGGFLDRIDAVLFTTPLVYYFVIWAIL